MVQLTINLKKDAQDSDLAHFIGDGAKLETFLTFSHLALAHMYFLVGLLASKKEVRKMNPFFCKEFQTVR